MQGRTRTIGLWSLLGVAALAAPLPASAVVIASGDGSGNTTAPADDPGFANVGYATNNLSGVYIGRGWVLTARHVGERAIWLGGALYQPVPGSFVQLVDPIDPNAPKPDLAVYKLEIAPPMPALALSSATPGTAEEVLCVGNGWQRHPNPTQWDLNWVETTPPGVYRGFKKISPRAPRWGRNLATGSGIDWGDTVSFDVAFDEAGLSDEFQAVAGDSGGGCFAKRGGWELVGIMWARTRVPDPNDSCPPGPQDPQCNPPPPAQPLSTAAWGNLTVIADIWTYRDQILDLTPEPPSVPASSPLALPLLVAVLAGAGAKASRRCETPTSPRFPARP